MTTSTPTFQDKMRRARGVCEDLFRVHLEGWTFVADPGAERLLDEIAVLSTYVLRLWRAEASELAGELLTSKIDGVDLYHAIRTILEALACSDPGHFALDAIALLEPSGFVNPLATIGDVIDELCFREATMSQLIAAVLHYDDAPPRFKE